MLTAHKWFSRLNTVLIAVAIMACAAMMVQVSLDVISKYLFNYPIPLTLEAVASFHMVALIFLPLGLVTRERGHVGVDLFTRNLSERRLAVFDGCAGLLGVAYAAVLIWFTTSEALHKTRIGETWETAFGYVEVWPARWLVPAGCVAMALWFALLLIDDLRFAATGERSLPSARSADEAVSAS
ncbi:TRAP transporter small permease [Pikeienuella piscinae]|uniref:TRAP transporter small permease protein n=1 Tax=Pikeienuella piscinae TaxID=2748098 RepID=A0A7L5BST9_9RHOB|nr:TRAP transporter small permease [Pikeienuella piscinae]QIE54385.1 TRAP transporter small permease [Pikeienuella piscinae]